MAPEEKILVQQQTIKGLLDLLREGELAIARYAPKSPWKDSWMSRASKLDLLYAYLDGRHNLGGSDADSMVHTRGEHDSSD